jgi:hypothetical protein
MLAGDLAQNQVVSGQVGNYQRWSPLAGLKISLRKWQNNHFTN